MRSLSVIFFALPILLTAQVNPDVSIRPTSRATQINAVPKLDGEVINDELWQSIEPITELIQLRPNSGSAVSEPTEIRIAYDETTFYLSVICYDSRPDQLVVADARRDASLDDTDAFLFIIDTYHDNQNGFVFGTNAMGIEYDAQVDNEGQGNFNQNRQQGGVIGGFNLNWDGSWEVRTQVGDFGWSAEFEIPLRTIRYKSGDELTWGANFQRNIRKTNEIAYWAPLPIQFDIKRLSLAGDLNGFSLRSPGNLKVIPYVLGEVQQDHEGEGDPKTDPRGDFGFDVKYSVTPSLTLDLTYNTDFAQVEVDEVQVNLDRFNLFFPEKRPFFLENAGYFSAGSPGEVDLFFSRRIGINDNGGIVPIIGGARLSGRVGNTNIGFLSMFTESVSDTIPTNNYTVARVNQQLASRTTLGAAFISRYAMGLDSANSNTTMTIDTKIGLGKKAQIVGYVAKTSTTGLEDEDLSYRLQTQYEWDGLNLNAAYTEVQPNFNPEVGFLLRNGGFRKVEGLVFKQVRLKDGPTGLLELRPHVSYRGYWDFNGNFTTGFLHVDNHWEWRNQFEVHTGINFTTEGVVNAFPIYREGDEEIIIPAGNYYHKEAQIIFITNASKPLYISTRHIWGGRFGGTRYANSGTLGIRVGDKFTSELTYQRNDFSLDEGNFNTDLFKGRVSYSFTPRIFIQSLVQFNNVTDLWSANLRFGWLQQANTGLFVVYNQVSDPSGLLNRTLTVKYSRMFDLIK